MATISFRLNGKSTSLDADPNLPLLWALRDALKLTGTKFGCGLALDLTNGVRPGLRGRLGVAFGSREPDYS